MNSRERVIATLEHRHADRVPLGERVSLFAADPACSVSFGGPMQALF